MALSFRFQCGKITVWNGHLLSSEIRFLAVLGLLVVTSPEELNAPAANRHPKVPPPIMIIDNMTTRTFDFRDNSSNSVTKSGLF